MGTLFTITLYAAGTNEASAAAAAAFRRIADLDRMMTDYNPDSELMNIAKHPVGEAVRVSPDLFTLLEESQRVARETGGAFDITVGPYVRAWRAARKTKVLPTREELSEMRKAVGLDKLRLDRRARSVTLLAPHMQLDLGGIAKGYAADQALQLLRRLGIKSALVAASGDIAIGDAPPGARGWKIGIGSMDGSPGEFTQTLVLHNAGVSTSGDTEQFVEIQGVRYSHIIDPATGVGLTRRIQVSIIGPNATVTDGLDTPLSILGVERALAFVNARPELAVVIITQDDLGRHAFQSNRFKVLSRVE